MRLYVIRHGETDWNTERRAQGQTDIPLNEKGIELARVTSEALKNVRFDICYTSPLIRARQTAEIMIGDRDVPIIDEPRLKEIAFGIAEGKHFSPDSGELDDMIVSMLHKDPWNYPGFEGGETISDVVKRTGEFREELIADPDNRDKTIFISVHGCVLRAFLNSFYEDPSDFWQGRVPDNCAVTIADINEGRVEFIEKDRIFYDPSLSVKYFEWDK